MWVSASAFRALLTTDTASILKITSKAEGQNYAIPFQLLVQALISRLVSFTDPFLNSDLESPLIQEPIMRLQTYSILPWLLGVSLIRTPTPFTIQTRQ